MVGRKKRAYVIDMTPTFEAAKLFIGSNEKNDLSIQAFQKTVLLFKKLVANQY
jgi:hypothetical protein